MTNLFVKKYSNDVEGAAAFLAEQVPHVISEVWSFSPTTIDGVWNADGFYLDEEPRRIILYMAGYIMENGEVRETNDFEELVLGETS